MSTRDALRSIRGNVYGSQGQGEVLDVPRVLVYRSAALNIATGGVAVAWDTLAFDTDGMWSASNPTVLTCRTQGVYLVHFTAAMAIAAGGVRQVYIRINGANVYGAQTKAADGANVNLTTSWPMELKAGDTVDGFAVQNTGAPLALNIGLNLNSLAACLISTT